MDISKKISVVSLFISLIIVPAFADTYSDQGEKLYKAGDYKNAAKYFAQSLQANPNSRSLYYAACCFLKLGDIANATNTFQLIIDNFPQSQEATLAKSALQSLAARNNTAREHSASLMDSDSKDIRIINDPLADKLISIYRHTENTDRIVEMIKAGLGSVPQHVKEVLADNGYQILIAPMTMDITSDQDSKPRGYNDGGSWDNVGGLFQPTNKRVIVGERVSWRSSPPELNKRAGMTIRHEIGHAYDQYMGKTLLNSWTISSSPFFRQTYAADAQRLTNTQRREFDYFVQPNGAGENELFAELFFTNCLAGDSGTRRSNSAQELARTFPQTFKLVQDLVEQRGLERFSPQE